MNHPANPPTQRPQNILILGATGLIGTYITNAIITSKSNFKSISIFTSPSTLNSKPALIHQLSTSGIQIHSGSLDSATSIKTAIRTSQIDTIISCLGRDAITLQIPVIDWAAESGVRRFFASEYGTDIAYGPSSRHEPPHQKKLAVRAHITQTPGVEYTYVVTGPYSDLYLGATKVRPELGTFDVLNRKACLLGDGNGSVAFTAMVDVGKYVVQALLNPEVSCNATLKVHSFTATPAQILEEFERQTDSKWEVTYTSLEKLKEIEKDAYERKSPVATLATLRRIWTEGGTLYERYDDEESIGGFERQTLKEQVREEIKKQIDGGV